MSNVKLINTIHASIVDSDKKTVTASIIPEVAEMEKVLGLEGEVEGKKDYLEIVKHRIEETLFQPKTTKEHCQWLVDAVKGFVVDGNLPLSLVNENKLRDYCVDVIAEILKANNPNIKN